MFDERQHPLDDSNAWLETPEDDDVVDFLRTIQQALHLEMSCIVTALILLERGMLRAKLRTRQQHDAIWKRDKTCRPTECVDRRRKPPPFCVVQRRDVL